MQVKDRTIFAIPSATRECEGYFDQELRNSYQGIPDMNWPENDLQGADGDFVGATDDEILVFSLEDS
jgi:hypothetical protein